MQGPLGGGGAAVECLMSACHYRLAQGQEDKKHAKIMPHPFWAWGPEFQINTIYLGTWNPLRLLEDFVKANLSLIFQNRNLPITVSGHFFRRKNDTGNSGGWHGPD